MAKQNSDQTIDEQLLNPEIEDNSPKVQEYNPPKKTFSMAEFEQAEDVKKEPVVGPQRQFSMEEFENAETIEEGKITRQFDLQEIGNIERQSNFVLSGKNDFVYDDDSDLSRAEQLWLYDSKHYRTDEEIEQGLETFKKSNSGITGQLYYFDPETMMPQILEDGQEPPIDPATSGALTAFGANSLDRFITGVSNGAITGAGVGGGIGALAGGVFAIPGTALGALGGGLTLGLINAFAEDEDYISFREGNTLRDDGILTTMLKTFNNTLLSSTTGLSAVLKWGSEGVVGNETIFSDVYDYISQKDAAGTMQINPLVPQEFQSEKAWESTAEFFNSDNYDLEAMLVMLSQGTASAMQYMGAAGAIKGATMSVGNYAVKKTAGLALKQARVTSYRAMAKKAMGEGDEILAKQYLKKASTIGSENAIAKTQQFAAGMMINNQEIMQQLEEVDGLSVREAAAYGLIVTMAMSAIEMIGGPDAVLVRNMLKKNGITDEIKSEIVDEVKKYTGKRMTGKMLKKVHDKAYYGGLKKLANASNELLVKGALSEGSEELAQSVWQDVAANYANKIFELDDESGFNADMASPETWASYFNAAVAGATVGSTMNLNAAQKASRISGSIGMAKIIDDKGKLSQYKNQLKVLRSRKRITEEEYTNAEENLLVYESFNNQLKGVNATRGQKKDLFVNMFERHNLERDKIALGEDADTSIIDAQIKEYDKAIQDILSKAGEKHEKKKKADEDRVEKEAEKMAKEAKEEEAQETETDEEAEARNSSDDGATANENSETADDDMATDEDYELSEEALNIKNEPVDDDQATTESESEEDYQDYAKRLKAIKDPEDVGKTFNYSIGKTKLHAKRNESGGVDAIFTHNGTRILEYTTRTLKNGKKIKVKNAMWSRAIKSIDGTMSDSQIKAERKQRLQEAKQNFNPVDARTYTLQAIVEGKKVNIADAKKELGDKPSLATSKNAPSVTKVAEDIAADIDRDDIDDVKIKEALLEILSEYNSIDEIVDDYIAYAEGGYDRDQEIGAYAGSLTEEEEAMMELVSAEEDMSDEELRRFYTQEFEKQIDGMTSQQQQEIYEQFERDEQEREQQRTSKVSGNASSNIQQVQRKSAETKKKQEKLKSLEEALAIWKSWTSGEVKKSKGRPAYVDKALEVIKAAESEGLIKKKPSTSSPKGKGTNKKKSTTTASKKTTQGKKVSSKEIGDRATRELGDTVKDEVVGSLMDYEKERSGKKEYTKSDGSKGVAFSDKITGKKLKGVTRFIGSIKQAFDTLKIAIEDVKRDLAKYNKSKSETEKLDENHPLVKAKLDKWKLQTELGTDIHFLAEAAIENFGALKTQKGMPKDGAKNNAQRLKIKNALQKKFDALKAKGSTLIGEYELVDPNTGLIMVIDVLEVLPDGSLNLYDFKVKKRAKSNPESYRNEDYAEQYLPDSPLADFLSTNARDYAIQMKVAKRALERLGYKVNDTRIIPIGHEIVVKQGTLDADGNQKPDELEIKLLEIMDDFSVDEDLNEDQLNAIEKRLFDDAGFDPNNLENPVDQIAEATKRSQKKKSSIVSEANMNSTEGKTVLSSFSELEKIKNKNSRLSNIARILSEASKNLHTKIVFVAKGSLAKDGKKPLATTRNETTEDGDLITSIGLDGYEIMKAREANQQKDLLDEIIVHEEIHRYTGMVLKLFESAEGRSMLSPKELKFAETINGLFQEFQMLQGNMFDNIYNTDEFIAHGLTDKAFIKYLQKQQVKDKTIFEHLLDALKTLFGGKQDMHSVLEAAFTEYMNLPSDRIREMQDGGYYKPVGQVKAENNQNVDNNLLRQPGESIPDFMNRSSVIGRGNYGGNKYAVYPGNVIVSADGTKEVYLNSANIRNQILQTAGLMEGPYNPNTKRGEQPSSAPKTFQIPPVDQRQGVLSEPNKTVLDALRNGNRVVGELVYNDKTKVFGLKREKSIIKLGKLAFVEWAIQNAKDQIGKQVELTITPMERWNPDGKTTDNKNGLPYGDIVNVIPSDSNKAIGKMEVSDGGDYVFVNKETVDGENATVNTGNTGEPQSRALGKPTIVDRPAVDSKTQERLNAIFGESSVIEVDPKRIQKEKEAREVLNKLRKKFVSESHYLGDGKQHAFLMKAMDHVDERLQAGDSLKTAASKARQYIRKVAKEKDIILTDQTMRVWTVAVVDAGNMFGDIRMWEDIYDETEARLQKEDYQDVDNAYGNEDAKSDRFKNEPKVRRMYASLEGRHPAYVYNELYSFVHEWKGDKKDYKQILADMKAAGGVYEEFVDNLNAKYPETDFISLLNVIRSNPRRPYISLWTHKGKKGSQTSGWAIMNESQEVPMQLMNLLNNRRAALMESGKQITNYGKKANLDAKPITEPTENTIYGQFLAKKNILKQKINAFNRSSRWDGDVLKGRMTINNTSVEMTAKEVIDMSVALEAQYIAAATGLDIQDVMGYLNSLPAVDGFTSFSEAMAADVNGKYYYTFGTRKGISMQQLTPAFEKLFTFWPQGEGPRTIQSDEEFFSNASRFMRNEMPSVFRSPGYAEKFFNEEGNRKASTPVMSHVLKRADEALSIPKTQYYKNNKLLDYYRDSKKSPIPTFVISGLKNISERLGASGKDVSPEDVGLINFMGFFIKDSDILNSGEYLQTLGQFADKSLQVMIPVQKLSVEKAKKEAADIRKDENPDSKYFPSESEIDSMIERMTAQIEKWSETPVLGTENMMMEQSEAESLAAEYVYNHVVNSHYSNQVFFGRLDNYAGQKVPQKSDFSDKGLTIEQIREEIPMDELISALNSRVQQEKVKKGDVELTKKAYNVAKAYRKQNENEEAKKRLSELIKEKNGLIETKVGNVITITNEDNLSDYKATVQEIKKLQDGALLTVRTAKGKEYKIKTNKSGGTRTGFIENYVHEGNPEKVNKLKQEINQLKSTVQKTTFAEDFYIDYFEGNNNSKTYNEELAKHMDKARAGFSKRLGSMASGGIELMIGIDGGLQDTYKQAIFNESDFKLELTGPNTTKVLLSEGFETNDGILFQSERHEKEIQVSVGSAIELKDSLKPLVAYVDNAANPILDKLHRITLTQELVDENPDVLQPIYDAMEKGDLDTVVFNSGAKLYEQYNNKGEPIEVMSKAEYGENGKMKKLDLDTAVIVDRESRNIRIQQDLTNPGRVAKKRLIPQMLRHLKRLVGNQEVDSLLREHLDQKNYDFRHQLGSMTEQAKREFIMDALDRSDNNADVVEMLDEGVSIEHPVIENYIFSTINNAIKKSVLDINSKGALLSTITDSIFAQDLKPTRMSEDDKTVLPGEVLVPEDSGFNEGDIMFITRMPADDLHSINKVVVAGFLPKSAGNKIAVAPGERGMAGEDLDGDQRHVWIQDQAKYIDPSSKEAEKKLIQENKKRAKYNALRAALGDEWKFYAGNNDIFKDAPVFELNDSENIISQFKEYERQLVPVVHAFIKSVQEPEAYRNEEPISGMYYAAVRYRSKFVNSPEAIVQKLFDMASNEYSKPENFGKITHPVDTDRLDDQLGPDQMSGKNHLDPFYNVAVYDANRSTTGKNSVIGVIAKSIATAIEITGNNIPIYFNGVKIKHSKKELNDIFIFMGDALNQSTDNAKLMKLHRMGLNNENSSLYAALMLRGMSLPDIRAYMETDLVKEFFENIRKKNLVSENSIDYFMSPNRILKEYHSQDHVVGKVDGQILYSEPYLELKNNLTMASELFKFGQLMNVSEKGVGKWSELQMAIDSLDSFRDSEFEGHNGSFNYIRATKDLPMYGIISQAIETQKYAEQKFSIMETQEVKSLEAHIHQTFGQRAYTSIKANDAFKRIVQRAIMEKVFPSGKSTDMLFGEIHAERAQLTGAEAEFFEYTDIDFKNNKPKLGVINSVRHSAETDILSDARKAFDKLPTGLQSMILEYNEKMYNSTYSLKFGALTREIGIPAQIQMGAKIRKVRKKQLSEALTGIDDSVLFDIILDNYDYLPSVNNANEASDIKNGYAVYTEPIGNRQETMVAYVSNSEVVKAMPLRKWKEKLAERQEIRAEIPVSIANQIVDDSYVQPESVQAIIPEAYKAMENTAERSALRRLTKSHVRAQELLLPSTRNEKFGKTDAGRIQFNAAAQKFWGGVKKKVGVKFVSESNYEASETINDHQEFQKGNSRARENNLKSHQEIKNKLVKWLAEKGIAVDLETLTYEDLGMLFSIDGNPEWRDAQRRQNNLRGTWRDDMYSYFYNKSEPKGEGRGNMKNIMTPEVQQQYEDLLVELAEMKRHKTIFEADPEAVMPDDFYENLKELEVILEEYRKNPQYFKEVPLAGPMNLKDFKDRVMPQYTNQDVNSMTTAAREQLMNMYEGTPGEMGTKAKKGYIDEWYEMNAKYFSTKGGVLTSEQNLNKHLDKSGNAIKALEELISDLKKEYKTVAAEFPLKILQDRLAKERIVELVKAENQQSFKTRNIATRALYDIFTITDNKNEDWDNRSIISGEYSMVSPSRVQEGVMQLNEILLRERARIVQTRTADLNDQFKEINDRIRKTKADLNQITYEKENTAGETIQYFIRRDSEQMEALHQQAREGNEQSKALYDFLKLHYDQENLTGNYSWDATQNAYRVPQVESDIFELLFGNMEEVSKKEMMKMLVQKNVLKTFKSRLAAKSGMDEYFIDTKKAGVNNAKYGVESTAAYGEIKNAIMEKMDTEGSGVQSIKNNAAAIRDLRKLKTYAESMAKLGTDDFGKATSTQALDKIKPMAGFVKTDTTTTNIAAAVSRHHQGMIFKSEFEVIAPMLTYTEGYLQRSGYENMGRWLKLRNQEMVYKKTPDSWFGKYEGMVDTLASFTYGKMLGLNFLGGVMNAAQGFMQTYREIGIKPIIKAYKRLGEQSVSGKPQNAFIANRAIKLMGKFDIVSVSKDTEMNITNKTLNKVSNVLFMNIVIPEYLNHAFSFIGEMTDAEWNRIAPLMDADASRSEILHALGGLNVQPDQDMSLFTKEERDVAYKAGLLRVDELQEHTQRINGAYAHTSKRRINATPEGRLATMFKNWLPELYRAHQSKEFSDLYDYNRKGMGESAIDMVKVLKKKKGWKELAWVMTPGSNHKENFELLSEVDQNNIQKILRETLTIGVIALAYAGLYGGDDDDMTKADRELEGLMQRLLADAIFIYNPESYVSVTGVLPVMKTLEDIVRFSAQLVFWEKYDSTNAFVEKGDLKIGHYVYANIPYVNQLRATTRTIQNLTED